MTADEVLAVMRTKAADLLDLEPAQIQPDVSFVADLHVDSLSLVEFTMELEDTFGVELPDDELAELTTIGDFVALIVGKADAAAAADTP